MRGPIPSMVRMIDSRVQVRLQDGTVVVGTLKSFDQFLNLVLDNTYERTIVPSKKLFAHLPLGTFIIRGENVEFFGEMDEDKDEAWMNSWTAVPADMAKQYLEEEQEAPPPNSASAATVKKTFASLTMGFDAF